MGKIAMTLRRKIFLIIGVTLVALILGLYKVSSSILLTDFSRSSGAMLSAT